MEDRQQLLRLLQAKETLESERPIDTRPTIQSLFCDQIRGEYAAKSRDPEMYRHAWDEHMAAVCRHSTRLARERPRMTDLPSQDELRQAFEEARAAATAAGFPPPWKVVPPPEPAPPEPDPLEAMKRKTLPRSVRRDIEDSQTRHGETATFEHIIAEQRATSAPEADDKLRWFRGNEPSGVPPFWPDS